MEKATRENPVALNGPKRESHTQAPTLEQTTRKAPASSRNPWQLGLQEGVQGLGQLGAYALDSL